MTSFWQKKIKDEYRINKHSIDWICRTYGFKEDQVKKVLFPSAGKIRTTMLNSRKLTPQEATLLGIKLKEAGVKEKLEPVTPIVTSSVVKTEEPVASPEEEQLTKWQLAGMKAHQTRMKNKLEKGENGPPIPVEKPEPPVEVPETPLKPTSIPDTEQPRIKRKYKTRKQKLQEEAQQSALPEKPVIEVYRASNRNVVIHLLKQAIQLLEEEEMEEIKDFVSRVSKTKK